MPASSCIKRLEITVGCCTAITVESLLLAVSRISLHPAAARFCSNILRWHIDGSRNLCAPTSVPQVDSCMRMSIVSKLPETHKCHPGQLPALLPPTERIAKMVLSVEAIVAIVTLFVACPPAFIITWKLYRCHGSSNQRPSEFVSKS